MTLSEIYIALYDANHSKDYSIVTTEVKKLNLAYRNGDPLITDSEYDTLLQCIKFANPENEIFNSGVIETEEEINPTRKVGLKFPMYSLDKEHYIEDIHKRLINKGLQLSTLLVCTSKYDGISILKNEKNGFASSRGDGVIGESLTEHYKQLGEKNSNIEFYTIGEMLIPKPVFASKTFYRDNGEPFKNARNMIAGLKNNDKVSDDLKYAKHVRYGLADDDFTKDKIEQLDFIAKELHVVPYKVFRADELNIDVLNNLFIEWGKEFDIDGLVFDINDKDIRKKLGRGTNNNVAYAVAFKNPDWSEKAKTTITQPVIGVGINRQTFIDLAFGILFKPGNCEVIISLIKH